MDGGVQPGEARAGGDQGLFGDGRSIPAWRCGCGRPGNKGPACSEVWPCLETLSFPGHIHMGTSREGEVTGPQTCSKCHGNTTLMAPCTPRLPRCPQWRLCPQLPDWASSLKDSLCRSLCTAAKLMFALLMDINDLPFTARHRAEHVHVNWVGGVKLSASICYFSA